MVNWAWAKNRYASIVANNGVWIQYLTKVTSGSGAYDTSNISSFGYGDFTDYYVTGSVKAIVVHKTAIDKPTEAGLYQEHIEEVYVDPDLNAEYWDLIIYPSGSGAMYLIMPPHVQRLTAGNTVVAKYFAARLLVPRSGSAY